MENHGTFCAEDKRKVWSVKMKYETYIFDLYGTLVDIHTEEEEKIVWEKLALFYGYYEAIYDEDT